MYKHILIATDGTELSDKALHQGLALAKALGAEATVVTATEPWESVIVGEVAVVLPPEKFEEMASANAMGVLNKAKELAEKDGVACRTLHVRDRHPADGILAAAQEKGCDLIVMGSHGRRGLSRMVLGSKANEVMTHSTIPVLIVR
jgi:nucleotide-binding universal stress UspA family protein